MVVVVVVVVDVAEAAFALAAFTVFADLASRTLSEHLACFAVATASNDSLGTGLGGGPWRCSRRGVVICSTATWRCSRRGVVICSTANDHRQEISVSKSKTAERNPGSNLLHPHDPRRRNSRSGCYAVARSAPPPRIPELLLSLACQNRQHRGAA